MKVWLGHPDAPAMMGGLPDGVEVVPWDGVSDPPDEFFEVEFLATGFGKKSKVMELIPKLPKLRVVHIPTSGYEHMEGVVPEGVMLCHAAGAHDASVAEWVVAAMLAMIREFPEEVLKQAAGVREQTPH